MSNNGHETRQSRSATLPLILYWNTKRGPVEPSDIGKMVKGRWTLYSAQSLFQHMPRSPVHPHIHRLMAEAAMQGANLLIRGETVLFTYNISVSHSYMNGTNTAIFSTWPKDTAEQHISTISLLWFKTIFGILLHKGYNKGYPSYYTATGHHEKNPHTVCLFTFYMLVFIVFSA